MADHYDRAERAAELKLRNTVLQPVENGWCPAHAFEVPVDQDGEGGDAPCESSSADETSYTSSGRIGELRDNDIADWSTLSPTHVGDSQQSIISQPRKVRKGQKLEF